MLSQLLWLCIRQIPVERESFKKISIEILTFTPALLCDIQIREQISTWPGLKPRRLWLSVGIFKWERRSSVRKNLVLLETCCKSLFSVMAVSRIKLQSSDLNSLQSISIPPKDYSRLASLKPNWHQKFMGEFVLWYDSTNFDCLPSKKWVMPSSLAMWRADPFPDCPVVSAFFDAPAERRKTYLMSQQKSYVLIWWKLDSSTSRCSTIRLLSLPSSEELPSIYWQSLVFLSCNFRVSVPLVFIPDSDVPQSEK